MKIIAVHEGVVPISSSIRNAWIDFSSMDCSIVAVVSDVMRDGEPVVGYGFNSNGRYSAGEILRRRIIPRLLDAAPEALLADNGQLDPTRAWDFMMNNEKPGGHGERSVAVGVVDMALFDLASKIAGQPLYRWLSDRYGDGRPDDEVFVYAAGGYYAPGKTLRDLQDEMKGFLDQGYRVVKMKIGGASLTEDLERIEAVLEVLDGDGSRLAVDVNGRFDLATALEIVLASTITAVGHMPLAALALIVGIDRILNEGRVFINVLGNAVAAIVIGKWEKDFDLDKANIVLRAGAAKLEQIEAEYDVAEKRALTTTNQSPRPTDRYSQASR